MGDRLDSPLLNPRAAMSCLPAPGSGISTWPSVGDVDCCSRPGVDCHVYAIQSFRRQGDVALAPDQAEPT